MFILLFFLIISPLFSERGDLISTESLSTKSLNNNQGYIDEELSALASDSFFSLTVEYGYRLYKINYETIDKDGNPTEASGVICYPRSDWPNNENQAYPILSYQHGTAIEKSSVTSHTGVWVLPALIAGYGYVYLEPDYLGLGDSDGLHPYHIKELYGTDVTDMIRAAKQFSSENPDFKINDQLFLAGYSVPVKLAVKMIIRRLPAD